MIKWLFHFSSQARRHAGTQARRHAGTQARRHAGTKARRHACTQETTKQSRKQPTNQTTIQTTKETKEARIEKEIKNKKGDYSPKPKYRHLPQEIKEETERQPTTLHRTISKLYSALQYQTFHCQEAKHPLGTATLVLPSTSHPIAAVSK